MSTPMSSVVDYLEAFGCDMQHPGAYEFVGLFNGTYSRIGHGGRGPQAWAALLDLAAAKGRYHLAMQSQMKAAIKPLLEAEQEALEYFGIAPDVKRTVCGVADALASALYAEYGCRRQELQHKIRV